MGMSPWEIVMSPYDVYIAPEGEAMPVVDSTPAGNWALLGTNGKSNYSEDGVTVTHGQTINAHRTLGSLGPVKSARTEEELMVGLVLEDVSMEQYAKVLNDVAVTDTPAASGVAGIREITMRQGEQPAVFALLVKGQGPYGEGWPMQFYIPRCFQNGSPAPVFTKGEAAGLEVEFMALEDLTAATEAERFGKIVAQDADPLP